MIAKRFIEFGQTNQKRKGLAWLITVLRLILCLKSLTNIGLILNILCQLPFIR